MAFFPLPRMPKISRVGPYCVSLLPTTFYTRKQNQEMKSKQMRGRRSKTTISHSIIQSSDREKDFNRCQYLFELYNFDCDEEKITPTRSIDRTN